MSAPLRWSNLRHMAESPAHYQYHLTHPIEPTPAMKFGSLVHALVLGVAPNSFVVYDGQRRGNAWTEFKEAHSGVEIVTADEWARASDCADAVKSDPVCGKLIRSGLKEHRLTWSMSGRDCAGTPDINGNVLVDLKVTPMTNPNRLPWHARKMLWHGQLAWYLNGATIIGEAVKDVYLIAVTPKPPHICVAYGLTPDTLELGHKQWRLLFERLQVCEASDQWPGYSQDVIPLDMDDDELSLVIEGEEVEI